ncbi:MAG: sialidase family protein [Candidatus Dormibacteria bacterium]
MRQAPPALAFTAVMLLSGTWQASAGTPAIAPSATFTANVRADALEGTATGQNEPVVAVDQTGRTYVTWQSATRPGGGATDTVATTDGTNFTALGSTDPTGSQGGDVALATTSWPVAGADTAAGDTGSSAIFWADLGRNTCGPLGFRASFSTDAGATWSAQDAGCQPAQIDRDWIASYTPPQYRGTTQAWSHTLLYDAYHDFGPSNVWVSRSTDGGQTWTSVQQSAIQAGSAAQLTSTCNTYPGGVAVDQNGAHAGRVYVVWNTGDPAVNGATGCNITSAQPFDHIFISYSDDGGATWTSHAVFNDPCDPAPPAPPATPTTCQDTSEGWTPVAVDDSGNVYVAFTWRDVTRPLPEYDVYLEVSRDGGASWDGGTAALNGTGDAPGPPMRVSTTTGTNFYPELAAAGNGGVDIAYYRTPFVSGVGALNKPAASPGSAQWDVWFAQSLDVVDGSSFTVSKVSDHSIYFGDICTVGIACGTAIPGTNWAIDRTLYDNFGVAVGPDGGARIAWTDARDSWTGTCQPGGTDDSNVPCQTTHVYFACQSGGAGIRGQTVTACGVSTPTAGVAETPVAPALVLLGSGAAALLARRRRAASGGRPAL